MTKVMFILVLALYLQNLDDKLAMHVEAALCEVPSTLFHGGCSVDSRCARICKKEGYLTGKCKGVLPKCICLQDCGGKPPEVPPPEGPPEVPSPESPPAEVLPPKGPPEVPPPEGPPKPPVTPHPPQPPVTLPDCPNPPPDSPSNPPVVPVPAPNPPSYYPPPIFYVHTPNSPSECPPNPPCVPLNTPNPPSGCLNDPRSFSTK